MKNWRKEKPKINLAIDAIMFVVLMTIAGLGFMIKYVLVPGYKRNTLYGSDVELYFLGLTRHQWGNIHLWLSFFLLFLLALHIILHWKIIGSVFRQIVSGKAIRKGIAVFVGAACIFLALAPLFVSPEVAPLLRKHIRNHDLSRFSEKNHDIDHNKKPFSDSINLKQGKSDLHKHKNEEIEVYGYMTLDEISEKYDIPVAELTKALDIPTDRSNNRLGRLKKQYNFHINDVRNAILKINMR
jgi:hypothetical protein